LFYVQQLFKFTTIGQLELANGYEQTLKENVVFEIVYNAQELIGKNFDIKGNNQTKLI
jgi:hypothetical protein